MDYPRVTEILRCFTNFDKIPQQILANAAERGSSVHALCAGIANGNWIPDGMIGETLIGYVNSFKKWVDAQVVKFIIVEKRYTDTERCFSGQLDYVVLAKDDKLYLVDIKTSARPQKTYAVQLGAYDLLLQNNQVKVDGAMVVYLNKDGEFPEINLIEDTTEERRIFLSALDCWHYFNKGKKHVSRRTKRKPANE